MSEDEQEKESETPGHDGRKLRLFLLSPYFLSLLTLLIYLANSRYLGAWDTIPNELIPMSLLTDGNFYLDEFQPAGTPLPYYFKEVKGRIVSSYSVLPGLLNVPVFFIARLVGLDLMENRFTLSGITAAILAALSVLFLGLTLRTITTKATAVAGFTLLFAFGTCTWSLVSTGLWKQDVSMLFILVAVYCLMRKDLESTEYSGFFLTLAVVTRPCILVMTIPIAVYLLIHRRKAIPMFLLLAAVPLSLYLLYTSHYYGARKEKVILSHLSFGRLKFAEDRHEVRPLIKFPVKLPPAAKSDNGFTPGQTPPKVQQIPQSLAVTGNFLTRMVLKNGLNQSLSIGLSGVLFSPARGLLIYSPFFLFSLIFLAKVLLSTGQDPLHRALAVATVLFIAILAKYELWWGGSSFGYRLMLEIVPLLMIFLALFEEKIAYHRGFTTCLIILGIYSILIQAVGVFLYPSDFCYEPDLIHENTARLWDFKDTEITRCLKKLWVP